MGTRAGRERAEASREHLRRIHENWCRLHPERAAEERELRQRQVALRRDHAKRDKYSDGGTPETRARARRVHQGAIARLYRSGAISIHQYGAAEEIKAAWERVTMSAGAPTSWAVERIDRSINTDGFHEALGGVWNEMAYSRWCRALSDRGPVLAMITEDAGVVAVARRYRIHTGRVVPVLCAALDLWRRLHRDVREEVDEATLAAAQAGIL